MRIAVLLPCYNEGAIIGKVVRKFRAFLPAATIYVYDNNSTDETISEAKAAGAVVRLESIQGKGQVVCRMFADIDADLYVLCDGDGTYAEADAPRMIRAVLKNQLDMVTGVRVVRNGSPYRLGHQLGNRLLSIAVGTLFGQKITDLFSGYRVFSRRFVKSFPALSRGFEIETEITIHAIEMRMHIGEVETVYSERDKRTQSKLRTFRDGSRVLSTIALLLKEERPLRTFTVLALLLAIGSLALGFPVIAEFLETGLVLRLPTAILALGLMILATLSFFSGLILDSVTRTRRELRRLNYLSYEAPILSPEGSLEHSDE